VTTECTPATIGLNAPRGEKGSWRLGQVRDANVGFKRGRVDTRLRKGKGGKSVCLRQYPLEKNSIILQANGNALQNGDWEGESNLQSPG